MIPYKDWFHDFKECNGGQVLLANNKAYRVLGIGKISVKMHDGYARTLHEVRYVHELKRNLISIFALDKPGYTIKVTKGEMKISSRAMIIMNEVLESGLSIMVGNMLCDNVWEGMWWHSQPLKLSISQLLNESRKLY